MHTLRLDGDDPLGLGDLGLGNWLEGLEGAELPTKNRGVFNSTALSYMSAILSVPISTVFVGRGSGFIS